MLVFATGQSAHARPRKQYEEGTEAGRLGRIPRAPARAVCSSFRTCVPLVRRLLALLGSLIKYHQKVCYLAISKSCFVVAGRYEEQRAVHDAILDEREEFARQLLVLMIRAKRQAHMPPASYKTQTDKNRWKCAVSCLQYKFIRQYTSVVNLIVWRFHSM